MELTKSVHADNVVVLEINGEVDAYTAQELDHTIAELLTQDYYRIVMDLSNMGFISSAGIRSILFAHREAINLGGEVRLVGPTDQVRRTLESVGLFDLIKISEELEDSIVNW